MLLFCKVTQAVDQKQFWWYHQKLKTDGVSQLQRDLANRLSLCIPRYESFFLLVNPYLKILP